MNNLKTVTVAALITLAAHGAQAGALNEIYQQALASDPQLKAAQATYLADSEAAPKNRAALLPNLGLNANTTWNDTNRGDYNNHGYTVSLSQPLFDADAWFSFRRGEALSEQARLTFEDAQQTLIKRVVEDYLSVLRAHSDLETFQAQERAIKRRLDQVNAQFEVGLIAITDVQEAQASYDNARVARIEAEGRLDNSYEALERLTGQPATQVDRLRADYPVQSPAPAEPQPWLDKAWQGNLSLRAATAAVEAARRSAQSARAGHLPSLSLDASYDHDNGTLTSNTANETTSIGLRLQMPIFSGGLTSAQSREATQRMVAAQQNRENALRAVTQSTRSLLRNLNTDVLSVQARQQSIKSSETALKATEEGYNVGTRNVVDVLDAEQKLYTAQRDYANARLDYISNLFAFKQQVGTLSPEDLGALDEWLIKP